MSSIQSRRAPWYRLSPAQIVVILTGLGSATACGSVGPSQRPQEARGEKFLGVECEPGLVLDCEPACSRGDARACEIAGLGYLDGKVITQDLKRARLMLERACEKGHVLACSGWAKMAQDDQGVSLPAVRQNTLLDLGCKQGDGNACYRLGAHLLDSTSGPLETAKLQRAHNYFERACEADEVLGCLQIGIDAKTGRVGQRDLVKAVSLLGDACAHDLAVGCYELADLQNAPGTAVNNPTRAQEHFEKACTLNSGVACSRLATLMEAGDRNLARARDLHTRACGLDQRESCLALGHTQLASEPAKAETSFGKACRSGLVEGCFEQAKLLDGTIPDLDASPDQALPLFTKACEAKMPTACARAAHLELQKLTTSVIPRESRERIVNLVLQGCERERQAASCLTLGNWIAAGENGLNKDGKRAAALLGPLCAMTSETPGERDSLSVAREGHGQACHRLGQLHEHGTGVEQNARGAATLYEKGCDTGYKPACLSRAVLLWRGTGQSKRNPELAVAQFRQLCNDPAETANSVRSDACVHLGYAQTTGIGTSRDLRQAKKQFEHYCAEGVQLACAHLGHYLLSTKGTEADRKQGETLLRSACDSANGQGCFFLADLPSLTKTKRSELLARACQLGVSEACTFRDAANP